MLKKHEFERTIQAVKNLEETLKNKTSHYQMEHGPKDAVKKEDKDFSFL